MSFRLMLHKRAELEQQYQLRIGSFTSLWHSFKDQWACIPYGTAWKTNGLVSLMAQLWVDQWDCIPYGVIG
jgi:hypothetical protein